MKKIGLIALLVMLVGCAPEDEQDNKPSHGNHIPVLADAYVAVWIDAETGCQYLHDQYTRVGLTHRLGENGKPMCGIKH